MFKRQRLIEVGKTRGYNPITKANIVLTALFIKNGGGLSGVSTLAFSSFIAILSIVFFAYITALYMNKNKSLPMCFVFDWDNNTKKKDNKLLYDI